ncbi:28S rRNA (cytosine-C(5))-methyltransferase-like [Hydractinia symbiolongicarpus]|uniref:28S rRNA (cytosine-C(5))-methyltransferase-like n=1 Tax=Hydractinia symbiolongicarpus TaxID=13093 RepID=UPI00254DDB28|nr:28S rRNA (cytosine-C(5))-methyltransferase-like [Hydractinia symbiolongicarpus]
MAPRLYEAAATVIEKTRKKEGSVKTLCFSSRFHNKKQLAALVLETIKHLKILEKVVLQCQLVWTELPKINESLRLILLYETLLGRGIPIDSKYYGFFQTHDQLFRSSLNQLVDSQPGAVGSNKKKTIKLPRYVRVNTIKISTVEAIGAFIKDGFTKVDSKEYHEISTDEFTVDQDIDDLLVFSSTVDLHENELYKQGKIFLQDKASCLPAFILNPPPQSFIIDACAAPGNKSSHLACIINNKGRICSFDLDKARLAIMNKLLRRAEATCVNTNHRDFLKVKHDDTMFSNVEYILLDPSCSGSGIVSRMDDLLEDEDTTSATREKRLKGLSGFQTAALSHALTFPHVKKVVYSTCSIHKEENEDVVEKACKRFSTSFRLVNIMPSWKNRGVGEWEEAFKCLRAVPEDDLTNGFFVAMFERIGPTVLQNKHKQERVHEDSVVKRKNGDINTEKHKNKKRKQDDEHKLDKNVSKPTFAELLQATSSKKRKKRSKRVKQPVIT